MTVERHGLMCLACLAQHEWMALTLALLIDFIHYSIVDGTCQIVSCTYHCHRVQHLPTNTNVRQTAESILY